MKSNEISLWNAAAKTKQMLLHALLCLCFFITPLKVCLFAHDFPINLTHNTLKELWCKSCRVANNPSQVFCNYSAWHVEVFGKPRDAVCQDRKQSLCWSVY